MFWSRDSSLRRMAPLVLAGLVGLAGNLAADEVGLLNGFVATLIVEASWLAFDPRRNVIHPNYHHASFGLSREELLAIQARYLCAAQIWLGVPTLVAALVGGWDHAAFYSFVAFGSAVVLGLAATTVLYQYARHRARHRPAV